MTRRPYSYTVLRYVHDVVTGEFVNVGIVLLAPAHEGKPPALLFQFRERIGRVRGMFPDVDRRSYQASVHALERRAKAVRREICRDDLFQADINAVDAALRIIPKDGSSLRWSELGSGISKDLNKDFHRIVHRMLERYDRSHVARKTDDDVWRPVRQALFDRKVQIEFEAEVISGDLDAIKFKHSWRNGQLHAYEPLSFDLADAEYIKDKARKWHGHLATVKVGASTEFQAHFIAGKPSNDALMPAYYTALKILRSAPSGPQVFEEGEIDDLVNQIEDEFRHHVEGTHSAH